MTVQSNNPVVNYTGNGVTTSFNAPSNCISAPLVILTDNTIPASPVVRTLVLNSDYTLTSVGGLFVTVSLFVAPKNAVQVLSILLNEPFTQLTHWVEGDPFPAASHEAAADHAVLLAQQLAGQIQNLASPGLTIAQILAPLASPAAGQGDALLTTLAPFAGAIAQTQHDKNSSYLTSSGFSSLAAAVAGLGATKTTFIIDCPVTVSSDLTIPANINLVVVGAGLITVAAGKRLFINGPFSAPRLQQAFSSALHTVSFTASVNATTMTVSAVASGVLSVGFTINGISGAPAGTTAALTGTFNGSSGTMFLNNPLGTIVSQAMTATGPSVIFAPGAVEVVYPHWFGAIADDGVTDNYSAIQQAIYSIPWGGTVRIPSGKYKVNSPSILHGGLTLEGEGNSDQWYGAPNSAASVPSFIWLGANTSIFVISGGMSNIKIKKLALSPASTPSSINPGTGKWGVQFEGHFPAYIWNLQIEDVWFYNLDRAISVNDSWAGNATYWNGTATVTYYDWAVNPVTVKNCNFWYSGIGIYFNTNNADAWRVVDSVFSLPSGGDGIRIVRCGYLKLDNDFSGGTSVSGNNFLHIVANGAGSLDQIVLDNCQVETATHSIFMDSASTNTYPQVIIARNCIFQMSADVYLGKMCEYISEKNEMLATVYCDATGVTVNSDKDNWGSGFHLSKLSGDATWLRTYIPGFSPDSNFPSPWVWIANRATVTGTVAPAGGNWNAGDRCVRNPPVVGSPKAWCCTVAGTPGTWVSEGNL